MASRMVVCVWVLGSGGKVGFFLMGEGAANHHRYQYSIPLQVCGVVVCIQVLLLVKLRCVAVALQTNRQDCVWVYGWWYGIESIIRANDKKEKRYKEGSGSFDCQSIKERKEGCGCGCVSVYVLHIKQKEEEKEKVEGEREKERSKYKNKRLYHHHRHVIMCCLVRERECE